MATPKRKKEIASVNKKTSKKAVVKEKLLVQLEKMPVVEVAAKRSGTSSSTYYRWINEDPMFARAAQQALDSGIQYINDVAESKVISGIFSGDRTMVTFWLKKRHKNYTDKQIQVHEVVDKPLTEERKKEIAEALKNWITPQDDDDAYTVNE